MSTSHSPAMFGDVTARDGVRKEDMLTKCDV